MKAIRFDDYGPGGPLHLADVAVPSVGAGQMLVRVKAAGVNPADAKWQSGMFREFLPIELPHIPGYDIAGVVEALGPDVEGFAVGDRVVSLLGNTTHGGYAEYAVTDAASAAGIPAGMTFSVAAALPVAGLTGAQMIDEYIRPASGDTILVTGAVGAVGRFAVHTALARGAVVVAAVRPAQFEDAKALGASAVVALDDASGSKVHFDHVVDTVGGPAVTAWCRNVAAGGRICTAATDPIDPADLATTPEFVFLHPDGERLAQIVADVAKGAVSVPIARELPLADAAQAQRLLAGGGLGGKVVLLP